MPDVWGDKAALAASIRKCTWVTNQAIAVAAELAQNAGLGLTLNEKILAAIGLAAQALVSARMSGASDEQIVEGLAAWEDDLREHYGYFGAPPKASGF